MKNTKNAKATCFYLKTPKKKIIQMSQINKILEIQFLFQWYKMIIKIYFCCDQSIHNQMLHNGEE